MKYCAPLIIYALAFAGAALSAAESPYHVVAHYKINGAADFDGLCLDADARRLYVAHGARIEVLNADSGENVGAISSLQSAHDVAVVSELKHGFVSDGATDSITMFDTDTLKVLKVIKSTGRNPAAIAYDATARKVFVANRDSGTLTVLDPASGEVISTVTVGGKLRQMVCNGYGWIFVAAEDQDAIHIVDTRSLKPLGDFPVAPGRAPDGLAIEPVTKRLFVGCGNGKLVVIDSDIGFAFTVLPIGSGASGVVCDRSAQEALPRDTKWKGRVLTVTADGVLSVVRMVSPVKWAFNGKTPALPGAHSIVFDPKTNRAFIPAVNSGALELLVVGY